MSQSKNTIPTHSYEADSDDSDFESGDDVTNVQLGLSDGQVEGDDEANPLISRIGGKAAWLPTQAVPPISVAHCRHCDTPMELLVQIFAPLEQSPYDRTLLAWGCCRPACQRKGQGSLRVIRHLQYNARWAARLEKQRAKQQAREERKKLQLEQAKAKQAEEEARRKINPFSSGNDAFSAPGFGKSLFGGSGGFGAGDAGAAVANPFAATQTPAAEEAKDTSVDQADADSDSDSDSIDEEAEEQERLADELAMKAAVQETASSAVRDEWQSQVASYQPSLYLSTVPEASSSARAGEKAVKAKLAKQNGAAADSDDDDDDDGDDDGNTGDADLKGFEKEGYERMMLAGMDDVLEKFIARVGAEGRQVVRYEMGGQPLPFSAQGDLYKQLWPASQNANGAGTAVSRGNHAVAAASSRPSYDPSRVPPCPTCGSKRTFEFQLMPNLVNNLRPDSIRGGQNDAQDPSADGDAATRRRRDLEAVLGKSLPSLPGADGVTRSRPEDADAAAKRLTQKTGLCWSTAIVFVCSKDCCIPDEGGKEGETWKEEWVGLQFED